MGPSIGKPPGIHFVSSTKGQKFILLKWALVHSLIIGLDAEWNCSKTVLLLQIACLLKSNESTHDHDKLIVFLLDLKEIDLPCIYDLLRGVFVNSILKLGFDFKGDLNNLSTTFRNKGCDLGLDIVYPYLDIATIDTHLSHAQKGKAKGKKGLSSICVELLGRPLNKEFQCSDWSARPLSEGQLNYAAEDASCLIEIFNVFQRRLGKDDLAEIVREYATKLELKESDGNPKTLKKKRMNDASTSSTGTENQDGIDGGEGPVRWGKFLCDALLMHLAEALRFVGIDAALPESENTETRELIEQAIREKRVFLTKDCSLKGHEGVLRKQIHYVETSAIDDQRIEVIKAFRLKIHNGQLMSRCIKCNCKFSIISMYPREYSSVALFGREAFWHMEQPISSSECLDEKLRTRVCSECNMVYSEGDECLEEVQKIRNEVGISDEDGTGKSGRKLKHQKKMEHRSSTRP